MDYFLNIPNKVDKILRILSREGFDAYVVGGCVRDILMGRKPHDWDITTSAEPAETEACFKDCKVIETGIKHGTVTVLMDGEPFEITTFRSDGAYSDGRHPDTVTFSKDIAVDLARRDFTINALAYSPAKGLIDEFGGLSDIRTRTIKAVGAPEERFREDSLRIMRAIRFAGTLGFMLEPGTARAVKALAHTAMRSSAERIMTELNKLIMGAYAAYAVKQFRTEINEVISFSGARIMDKKAVRSLEHAPASLPLRLALLLDVPDDGEQVGLFGFASDLFGAVPETDIDAFRDALRKMKYDNETIKVASAIKETAAKKILPEELVVLLEMRKLADRFPYEDVPDIMMDGISVRSLCGRSPDSSTEKLFGIIGGILEQGKCYSRAQLDITGGDLLRDEVIAGKPASGEHSGESSKPQEKTGLKPGKEVGFILSALLDEVIAGEVPNERSALTERAREMYKMLS